MENRIAALRATRPNLYTISTTDNQILTNQLWIGDAIDAVNAPWLRARSITAIVSLGETPTSYLTLPGIRYHRIVLEDEAHASILVYLDEATSFIHNQLTQYVYPPGRVLVHCRAGISRSASVCIAYMIRYYNMSYVDARACVAAARPCIWPNPGFVHQLQLYEATYAKLKNQ